MTAQDLELLRKIPRRRKIQLRGQIKAHTARFIISKLERMGRSDKPIRLNIHSRGGDYLPALEICDAIAKSRAPVYAVASLAASSAFVILQVCHLRVGRIDSYYKAKPARISFPVSVDPYTDEKLLASVTEEIAAKSLKPHVREVWKRAHGILLARVEKAGKTERELHELLAHGGTVLTAKEAKRWGFLDVIVHDP